jgi:hypothetical protein
MSRFFTWRLLLAGAALLPMGLVTPVTQAAGNDAFGFNGSVKGFPTGAVRVTCGGAYNLGTGLSIQGVASAALRTWGRDR